MVQTLVLYVCLIFCYQKINSFHVSNRNFRRNLILTNYLRFPFNVRNNPRLELVVLRNSVSKNEEESEFQIQDAFKRAQDVDSEWLQETLGGSLLEMIANEAPNIFQDSDVTSKLNGIYRDNIDSSSNESSNTTYPTNDLSETISNSESISESDSYSELDQPPTDESEMTSESSQEQNSSITSDQKEILALGYDVEDIRRLKPSVQRILLEKKIRKPRRGIPIEWMIPSAPVPRASIQSSSNPQPRTDQPSRRSATSSFNQSRGNNARNPVPNIPKQRDSSEPRRTRQTIQPQSSARPTARSRSTVHRDSSRLSSPTSRANSSPSSNRKSSVNTKPISTNNEEESVSLWPDREEFKDLLLAESRWRAKVGGDWLLPGIKQEAKWRYFLYKKWKDLLDQGTNYGFEPVNMPNFNGENDDQNDSFDEDDDDDDKYEDVRDDYSEYPEYEDDDDDDDDYMNGYDANDNYYDNDDDDEEEEEEEDSFSRPMASPSPAPRPVRKDIKPITSSTTTTPSTRVASQPPNQVSGSNRVVDRTRSVDRPSEKRPTIREDTVRRSPVRPAPPSTRIRGKSPELDSNQPNSSIPRKQPPQQQRPRTQQRRPSSPPPLSWEEKRERGYNKWLQSELVEEEGPSQWTDLSQEQMELIRESRRIKSLEKRNVGDVGMSGRSSREGRNSMKLSKDDWFADLDQEDDDDDDDDDFYDDDDDYDDDFYYDDDEDDESDDDDQYKDDRYRSNFDTSYDARSTRTVPHSTQRSRSQSVMPPPPSRVNDLSTSSNAKDRSIRREESEPTPRRRQPEAASRNIEYEAIDYKSTTTITNTQSKSTSSTPSSSSSSSSDSSDEYNSDTYSDIDNGGGEEMSEEDENILQVNRLLEDDSGSSFDTDSNTDTYEYDDDYDSTYAPISSTSNSNIGTSGDNRQQINSAQSKVNTEEQAFPSNFVSEQIRRRQRQKQRQDEEQEAFRRAWEASASRKPIDGEMYTYGTESVTSNPRGRSGLQGIRRTQKS